ncbi:hypothetical protein ACIGW7_25560 [Streptomyces sp. NPDC053253]|uniref:hypothetical protein n=1 Tax=Streptomyces sp. NPDC053253 TaxID=3365699 RepID=UPI0037D32D8C
MTEARGLRWAALAGALAGVTLMAGCAGDERRAGTLIGAESQVGVVWDAGDFPAGADYRLCADRVCRDWRAESPDDPRSFFSVPLPEATGEQRVTVRFQVTGPAGGRSVYDRTAQVTLRKDTPNGEGCSPTVWQAGLRADPGEGLLPVDRG